MYWSIDLLFPTSTLADFTSRFDKKIVKERWQGEEYKYWIVPSHCDSTVSIRKTHFISTWSQPLQPHTHAGPHSWASIYYQAERSVLYYNQIIHYQLLVHQSYKTSPTGWWMENNQETLFKFVLFIHRILHRQYKHEAIISFIYYKMDDIDLCLEKCTHTNYINIRFFQPTGIIVYNILIWYCVIKRKM